MPPIPKLLLTAFLLLSATLGTQLPGGVVTGIVRDAAGKPQPEVRVAAVATPEQSAGATVMVAISRTDKDGRYRLEVPPGRFFIAAGRIDKPTYYPRSLDQKAATTLQVLSGATISDADVVASAESLAPVQSTAVRIWQTTFGPAPPARPPTNLLPFLTGQLATQNPKFIFEFVGLTGRTANFKTVDGSFSYGCSDCSFYVRDRGVGPQTGDPGMLFKVGPNGQSLDYTCFASVCNLAQLISGSISISQLSRNQAGTAQTTDEIAFGIVP